MTRLCHPVNHSLTIKQKFIYQPYLLDTRWDRKNNYVFSYETYYILTFQEKINCTKIFSRKMKLMIFRKTLFKTSKKLDVLWLMIRYFVPDYSKYTKNTKKRRMVKIFGYINENSSKVHKHISTSQKEVKNSTLSPQKWE